MDGAEIASFPLETSEKVERLLDVLEEMVSHPLLKGRFAMYGGTAINLFMLNIPRLSVDIDVTFLGNPDKEAMLIAKPEIETAIDEIAQTLGYSLALGKDEHAGRTFYLEYRSTYGLDNVKIDFTYLNRIPLLPIEQRTTPVREGLFVPALSDSELIAGKTKAYLSRVKVRDIYDISKLATLLNANEFPVQQELFHKVILFYATLSAAFPFGFENRELRFSNKKSELNSELYPMLRLEESKPSLKFLMDSASVFMNEWVLPRDEGESEFLGRFAEGVFEPNLLFGNGEIAKRAQASPEAAWKLININKMLEQ